MHALGCILIACVCFILAYLLELAETQERSAKSGRAFLQLSGVYLLFGVLAVGAAFL